MESASPDDDGGGMLRLAALAVVAVATVHILSYIGRPLWFDEIFTAIASRPEPGIDWPRVEGDVHPPGHILLVWAWQTVFGPGAEMLRLSNLLALPVIALAAWRLSGALAPRRMWLALALLIGNGLFLYFLTELRAYFLLIALSLLGHAALLRLVRAPSRTDLALLIAAALAASALHFFGTAIGGGLLVTAALMAPSRGQRIAAALGLVALLAGFALWLTFTTAIANGTATDLWLENDPAILPLFISRGPLLVAALLAVLVARARGARMQPGWPVLLLPSALALGVALALSLLTPVISEKNLVVVLPALALALAVAAPPALLYRANRSAVMVLAAAVLTFLPGYLAGRVHQNPRWVIEEAYARDCAGLPLYFAEPGFMQDYARRLYAPDVRRPQVPLIKLIGGSAAFSPIDYRDCPVVAAGWHEDGPLDDIAEVVTRSGLPLTVEPAPVDAWGPPRRFAGYILTYRQRIGGGDLQFAAGE